MYRKSLSLGSGGFLSEKAIKFAGAGEARILPFLASSALTEKEVAGFLENKQWLEDLVKDFQLKRLVVASSNGSSDVDVQEREKEKTDEREEETPPKVYEDVPNVKPVVLLYGSAVAGTAFESGDADFAIGFQKSSGSGDDDTSSFLQIDREEQPDVLSQLYDYLHCKEKAVGDQVRFQRIFRARIPILQYVPLETTPATADVSSSVASDATANSETTAQKTDIDGKPTPIFVSSSSVSRPQFVKTSKFSTRLMGSGIKNDDSLHGNVLARSLEKKAAEEEQVKTAAESSGAKGEGNGSGEDTKKKVQGIDISLSLHGYKNSLLMRDYIVERMPLLGPLMMALKHWGRAQGILNARRGWLSPYALSIMILHYANAKLDLEPLPLESVDLAHIAGGGSSESDGNGTNSSMVREKALPFTEEETTLANFSLNETLLQRLPNNKFLSSLLQNKDKVLADQLDSSLQGFFDFYTNEFDFDTDVVDIRHYSDSESALKSPALARISNRNEWHDKLLAGMTEKEKWDRLGHDVILIRDPFEDHSLGRSVDFFHAESIRESFRRCSTVGAFVLKNPELYDALFPLTGRK